MDNEIAAIFRLFFDGTPTAVHKIDTSIGDDDFRMVFIVETDTGSKYVLKLADNGFTFPEKIAVWQKTVEEYLKLGCCCPRIYRDKTGSFPIVHFSGRQCTAYAEDYAPFRPAEDRFTDDGIQNRALYDSYKQDIWRITAQIAALHLNYTEYPSAWCLFDTFCPGEKTDEVLENALNWKEYADTLPAEFAEQVGRIWRLWTENRMALEKVYKKLPASVFQADLNPSNILLNDEGNFVGLYDFNLCGKEVFLNYLMRENYGGVREEIRMIRDALRTAAGYYQFSDLEKNTAPMLYRCLKPLWFTRVEDLKQLGTDREAIAAFLDETEHMLTDPVSFAEYME